jgi:pimeloyl-ACP methyl ester carboxylesterase
MVKRFKAKLGSTGPRSLFIRMHGERHGGWAGTAVVLLHGYAETAQMWKPLAVKLAPLFTLQRRCVARPRRPLLLSAV